MAKQVLNLTVTTTFGYLCGNCGNCQVCGKGRKYPVTVATTDTVQAIWDDIVRQNPLIVEKQIEPKMFFEHEILDMERRIISYDMDEGSEIMVVMPPSVCCTGVFRKAPKEGDDTEEGNQSSQAPQQKTMSEGVEQSVEV